MDPSIMKMLMSTQLRSTQEISQKYQTFTKPLTNYRLITTTASCITTKDDVCKTHSLEMASERKYLRYLTVGDMKFLGTNLLLPERLLVK